MSSVSCAAPAVPSADPTEARRQRGLAIAALCKIKRQKDAWIVPSQNGPGHYCVRLDPPDPSVPLCDCPDYEARGEPCKHVYAVRFVIERESSADGSESIARTATVTEKTTAKRPTYTQDWPAYDRAQTTEKRHFQELLADLCRGVPEPPRKSGAGRKPIPLADAIFTVVFKVYANVSARRFMCDLSDAAERGHIAKAPHFSTIAGTLEMPEIAPILRSLIDESSLPLKAVEIDFALDSSGFSTSRFIRWFDHKYGKPRAEYDWVKCHLMCGVKTNIVTAVEIRERDSADAPQFKPLLAATARNFALHDVVADKGYTSCENIDAVFELGGTPYIPFRANATGARGGLYGKMFHFYSLHREEFLARYHKRSNVESTFSMIKTKFGDHVRSKTDTAMRNEALCKILCHNICCLIHSAHELGITPVFWQDEVEVECEPIAEPAESDLDPDEMIDAFAWV